MKIILITGTSRGIGEQLALQLLQPGTALHCISRGENPRLLDAARQRGCALTHHPHNLSELHGLQQLADRLLTEAVAVDGLTALYLINNAGQLSPVAPIADAQVGDMADNITINLLAPMVLTSAFIRHTGKLALDKRILNISSASAKYVLPSQSCYSAAKSGLDTFSRSMHQEQAGQPYPVKIAAVYPGMIDTQMQAEIRAVSREQFPYVDQFIELARQGQLQTAEATAESLIRLLHSEPFGSEPVVEQLAL